MAIFVRRSKVREIAEDIRKGIAKELNVDILDIPLTYIDEVVYMIVDSYNSLIFRDKRYAFHAGRIIGRLIKQMCKETRKEEIKEQSGTEEINEESKDNEEYLNEEEIEKIILEGENKNET